MMQKTLYFATFLIMAVIGFGLSSLVRDRNVNGVSQISPSTTQTPPAPTELLPSSAHPTEAIPEPAISEPVAPVLAVEQTVPSTGRPAFETKEGLVYEDFQLEPFKVTISKGRHGWTEINGLRPEVIDALAHNDLERARMIEEDLWIKRRELVYLSQPLKEALSTISAQEGELTTFMFPGFAGTQYEVVVTDWGSEINEEGVPVGWINGHLRHDPESSASLSYYANREVGSVISEAFDVNIGYEPREDGQIIIREADPIAVDYISGGQGCETSYSSHSVGTPNAFSDQN